MRRGQHTPKSRALIRERLKAYWADPQKRSEQAARTRQRMNKPDVRQRISERTRAALADPATRERQHIGLIAAWADDEKRERQAALTRERMARRAPGSGGRGFAAVASGGTRSGYTAYLFPPV